MKKTLATLLLICFWLQPLQIGQANNEETATKQGGDFTGLIFSWEEDPTNTGQIFLRTLEKNNRQWTKWYSIEADGDSDEKDGASSENAMKEALFSTNISSQFEYFVTQQNGTPRISNIKIEKILSQNTGQQALVASLNIPLKNHIISRSQWGSNEELTYISENSENSNHNGEFSDSAERSEVKEQDPEIKKVVTHDSSGREYTWPLQYTKDIKFIVVHHTASVANLENPKTAIQNIQYYHAVKRGWGDIGYNYLIDTDGKIYEGRKGGEGVISGHAKPINKASIGITVLGDYENNEVPAKILASLAGLIREKAKLHSIDLDGKTLYKDTVYNNIQGHYENTATSCPGQYMVKKLKALKWLSNVAGRKEPKPDASARYAFSDFEKREIVTTLPNTEKNFTIRLKNTGKAQWSSKTFLELTPSVDVPSNALKLPKILATLESPKVVQGNIGVFKGTIPASLNGGLYVPEAQLVINGSVRVKTSIPIPLLVQTPVASYEIVGRNDPPALLKPGKKAQAWIQLKNTGNITWKRTGKNRVMLGTSHPQDRASSFFKNKYRVAQLKEKEVKPGQTGTFVLNIMAPKSPGTYLEYFQPVMEKVMWMKDTGMHFTMTVEGVEKPLRVALSFSGKNPQIKSEDGMKAYGGGKLLHEFGKNELVTVASLKKGGYRIRTKTEHWDTTSPPRFEPLGNKILTLANYENHPAWNTALNDNTYRGILEVQKIDGGLRVISELPLEDYLKGLGEVSNGDPKEKIKTIIIMARSYAKYYRDLKRKFPGKPYDLDDDPDHTQKYIGYSLEARSPNITAAVQETTGQIVKYQGKPILTPYFSQSDGRTRSAEEVWGWKDTPYLISVPDEFCMEKKLKGHGVGLSGCGATELANQGKTATEIIQYYLKGVEISG
ncbi:MAG: SpoIID/LytB domain-containing protein [Patescibacteria group bacterium]